MVGIVEDQKFYFTDISPIKMMFPQGQYHEWSDQWWGHNYFEAFEL